MRLENLSGLPYQPAGRTRQFGNWAVTDIDIVPALNDGATFTRRFTYYRTTMLDLRWNCGLWEIGETYIGCGSASEQKGVNRILSGAGLTSVKYRRNGGNARYEAVA